MTDTTQQIATEAMAECHDAKRWAECVAVGDAWIAARGGLPALPAVWFAQSLMAVGRYQEAVAWGKVAVAKMPDKTDGEKIATVAARSTYAQALARTGHFVRARRVLGQMIRDRVDHPETLEKQGHITLAITDRWRDGWAMHEGRESAQTIPDGLMAWDGKAQGHVGVLHEQGIGDAVLFARWLQWVAETSGHPVTWFGPEQVLGRWMADLPHVVVGKRGESMTPVDFACWSMSLPYLAEVKRPKDVPAPVAPVSLVERRRFHRVDRTALRVGVCWKGAAHGWHDFERSFTAAQFDAITAPIPGVTFVNLTHDAPVSEAAPFAPVTFRDVYETGEVLTGLDLVVSVDTSVVHLAGSLGVPTLAIVPTVPDWRYQWPFGTGTPFYPSVTVLRRQTASDLTVLDHARALVEQYATQLHEAA